MHEFQDVGNTITPCPSTPVVFSPVKSGVIPGGTSCHWVKFQASFWQVSATPVNPGKNIPKMEQFRKRILPILRPRQK